MVKDSMTSVWIKIISSWLCFAMYALVMLLPPMCPDRNFGPAARAEEMAGAQTPACSSCSPRCPQPTVLSLLLALSREAAFAIRSWARRVDLRIGYGLNAGMMPAQPSSRREVQRVSAGCCDAVRNKMHAMYLRYSCTSAPRLHVRNAPSSAPTAQSQRPSRSASKADRSPGVVVALSAPGRALSAGTLAACRCRSSRGRRPRRPCSRRSVRSRRRCPTSPWRRCSRWPS